MAFPLAALLTAPGPLIFARGPACCRRSPSIGLRGRLIACGPDRSGNSHCQTSRGAAWTWA